MKLYPAASYICIFVFRSTLAIEGLVIDEELILGNTNCAYAKGESINIGTWVCFSELPEYKPNEKCTRFIVVCHATSFLLYNVNVFCNNLVID